jgi:hypothetical protein
VRPLLLFCLGAVVLEPIGVAIDQGLMYASDELAKLRYYWYRQRCHRRLRWPCC